MEHSTTPMDHDVMIVPPSLLGTASTSRPCQRHSHFPTYGGIAWDLLHGYRCDSTHSCSTSSLECPSTKSLSLLSPYSCLRSIVLKSPTFPNILIRVPLVPIITPHRILFYVYFSHLASTKIPKHHCTCCSTYTLPWIPLIGPISTDTHTLVLSRGF